jgi:rSAM/selenodomain-associated transferase 2
MPVVLSVVIPALNAATELGATLDALGDGPSGGLEVVVSDGGSADATGELALQRGARVVSATGGRGAQLVAGADAATGAWLLFLHADTVLEAGWVGSVEAFVGAPENQMRAGYFRFALDDDASRARRLESVVAWRSRRLGLAYGDQGLLMGRSFYDQLGGYARQPLMEDVSLVRRIGRGRLVALAPRAVTSSTRYHAGYTRRSLRNLFCLALYYLGVRPALIAQLYG